MTRVILRADEGKIYTDGLHYGTIIYLAEGKNPLEYYQISLEEYYNILENNTLSEG